jgi:hypothetical protein
MVEPVGDNPFPLRGYANQNSENANMANTAKDIEERVLRFFENLQERGADPRSIAVAKTNAQTAFMWAIRAIFKPERLTLPDDKLFPPAPGKEAPDGS